MYYVEGKEYICKKKKNLSLTVEEITHMSA